MSRIAIHTEGLGKRYHRGSLEEEWTLRSALLNFVRSPLSVFRSREDVFWALKDVCLDVYEGEVLGLIGRNGAGKSTLLKILSRITRPSAGFAELHGRVRSLLEVGTGFHAELTGRENTYLSGSILGMSKREIDRKFDEIVAFAEIEKFIDTPVKRYSSGMYVRLAFAVAAHLEPEILLVDEVLAVGDIKFQKRCLGKMGDVARQGRTVVLVSHQMTALRRLCNRVVWIDSGAIRMDGPCHKTVSAYESEMVRNEAQRADDSRPLGKAQFVQWTVKHSEATDPHTVADLDPVTVCFTADIHEPLERAAHGIALYNHEQQLIWASGTEPMPLEKGTHQFCHTFPMLPLKPGPYNFLVRLYEDGELLDSWNCTPELIIAAEHYQSGADEWSGVLNMPAEFELIRGNAPAYGNATIYTSNSQNS